MASEGRPVIENADEKADHRRKDAEEPSPPEGDQVDPVDPEEGEDTSTIIKDFLPRGSPDSSTPGMTSPITENTAAGVSTVRRLLTKNKNFNPSPPNRIMTSF